MSKRTKAIKPVPTDADLNPYEALADDRHRVAVDMRIDGSRLRYIAEQLRLTEQTIKDWFMRGGPCHDAYHFRKKQWADETAKLFDQIHDEIKTGATDAIVTLKKNARKGSTLAAIKLLEMAGFQAVEKVQQVTPTKVILEYVNPAPQLDGGDNTQDPVPTDPQAG